MTERLRKADWLVLPIPFHAEAVLLCTALHYARGASNTSTYRHGLYRAEEWPMCIEPWGGALWQPPTRTAAEKVAGEGWRGVLSLSRFVLHPSIPKNGASFLLGRSMRLLNRKRWPILLTYADTAEGHTGAIYLACNWTFDSETPAGDTWEDEAGTMRGRKRGGRTMTVDQMRAEGFTRRPSLPKRRFVHRLP